MSSDRGLQHVAGKFSIVRVVMHLGNGTMSVCCIAVQLEYTRPVEDIFTSQMFEFSREGCRTCVNSPRNDGGVRT